MYFCTNLALLTEVLCVKQVRLQKEQENRVKLELQVAELEEQVDQRTSDLSAAMEEKERLKSDLDHERGGKQVRGHGLYMYLGNHLGIVKIRYTCTLLV